MRKSSSIHRTSFLLTCRLKAIPRANPIQNGGSLYPFPFAITKLIAVNAIESTAEERMRIPICLVLAFHIVSSALPVLAGATVLPWQREMPLREAAPTIELTSLLDRANPQPDNGGNPIGGPSMTICNLKMRSTIWGPPDRITVSVTKNNVWDRRLHEFAVPTKQDITKAHFRRSTRTMSVSKETRSVRSTWDGCEGGRTQSIRIANR